MKHTLEALARHLQGELYGDGGILISNVSNIERVQPGEVTFAQDLKRVAQALASPAAAVIVSTQHASGLDGKPGIAVKNPKLAFARSLEWFNPPLARSGTVHSTAVLSDTAQLAPDATIEAHVVIGDRVRIGQRTVIEPGVYVGHDVEIGEDSWIGPNVVLYHQTRIGSRVRIHAGSVIGGDGFGYVFHDGQHVKVPQVGNVIIEDDVEIGCNTCVDRATVGSTRIGQGTKIDNQVQVAHNNTIGKHVILVGQVGLSGSVTIEDYAVLGGRVGAIDHVTIATQTQIGSCSLVTKSTAPRSRLWGFPARPVNDVLSQWAALARLPALLKTVTDLLARVARLERAQHPPTDAPKH